VLENRRVTGSWVGGFVLVLMFCCSVLASENKAEQTSKAFITKLSEKLELKLQEGREAEKLSDDRYLNDLISEHIVPYLDVDFMAQKIAGDYWGTIQDQSLSKEMKDAVIAALKRTYSVALAAYSGEKIKITHSKDYANYSLVRVQVKTRDRSHQLDFALRKNGDKWKVFDVSVDGVVFSKTLQSSLAQQFRNEKPETVISNLRGGDLEAL